MAILAALIITVSPTTASAVSLSEPNRPDESHRALMRQNDRNVPQAFVSGPWRVTIVDAIQSPAIEGIVDDTADGSEWIVMVADVANWSDQQSTLTLADLTLSTDASSATQSDQAVAIAEVNLRAGPGTDAAILAAIPEGSTVTVLGDPENGFLPVDTAGQQGWASAEFLSVDGTGASSAATIAADLAMSQAASDILDLAGTDESVIQPGEVERRVWAFLVTTGTEDSSIVLDGEALPLDPEQRQILNLDALPPMAEVPSLVVAESVEVTGSRTLEIEENGQSTDVQLFGIDTPVQRECFAQQAETRLQELVSNGVALEAVGDDYLVWVNGDPADAPTLVNLALMKEGLASDDDPNRQSPFGLWLSETDRQAQAADLGLWGECTGVHGSYQLDPTPSVRGGTGLTSTTLPTMPGISGAVARLFTVGGGEGRSGKTTYIAAAVIELDLTMPPETVEAASYTAGESMGRFVGSDSLTRLGATRGWNAAQETSAPYFGDWTRAFIHESVDGRYTSAHISIGQAPFVYTLAGVGEEADPLTDLIDIANRLFGVIPPDREPVPTTKYRTDGLWGMLPRLEHLSPGFVFEHEWVAVEGPVVSSEAQIEPPLAAFRFGGESYAAQLMPHLPIGGPGTVVQREPRARGILGSAVEMTARWVKRSLLGSVLSTPRRLERRGRGASTPA